MRGLPAHKIEGFGAAIKYDHSDGTSLQLLLLSLSAHRGDARIRDFVLVGCLWVYRVCRESRARCLSMRDSATACTLRAVLLSHCEAISDSLASTRKQEYF